MASEIIDEIINNAEVNYDKVFIKGDIYLNRTDGNYNMYYTSPIKITNSTVEGRVTLNSVTFREKVTFDNVKFLDNSYFINSVFLKDVEFTNCKFYFANFGECRFDRSSDFSGSSFDMGANFKNTRFMSYANFKNCMLNGLVDFQNSESDRVCFDNANFTNTAYFTGREFRNMARFVNTTFKNAYFIFCRFNSLHMDHSKVRGAIDFRKSTFANQTIFTDTHFMGYANLQNCLFMGPLDLGNSTYSKGCTFSRSLFDKNVDFSSARFLKAADFSQSQFAGEGRFFQAEFLDDADFSICSFNDTLDLGRSTFHGQANFMNADMRKDILAEDGQFKGLLNLNRTSYRRFFVRWDSINHLQYNETSYNLLVSNFKSLGLFEDANKCYYKFMCERGSETNYQAYKGKIDSLFISVFYFLAWILYGFGTRPEVPLAWSIFLTVGIFAPFWYLNCGEVPGGILEKYGSSDKTSLREKGDFKQALKLSSSIFLSGTKIFIDPPMIPEMLKRSNPWINRIYLLERTLGAAFFFLFFLAISKTIIFN